MTKERQTAIEHSRRSRQRQVEYARQVKIEELIEQCSAALGQGDREHYRFVAVKLRDDLIPAVREHTSTTFTEYDRKLSDSPLWDWVALTSFLEGADAYVDRLSRDTAGGFRSLTLQVRGYDDEDTAARLTVEKTLACMTAIAELEGIVLEDYASRVDAVGFSIKLGEHKQREDMDFGDPVVAVTQQAGYLKTLHTGGTSTGKSTGTERELEDYYRQNFDEGRDVKVIDLVGFGEGENWLYDVPQQQPDLRRARDDMDLPPSFEDIDGFDPDAEIYVPLAPGLERNRLPYDTETGDFVPTPFTVPASELSKELLVALITARLTDRKEQIIRDVYEVVDARLDDWSIRDLVDEIIARDELNKSHKRDAISPLRALQSNGFIRTKDDPHTLDWRDIFRNTQTLTVFSQALLEDELSQLVTVAYLLDKIWSERRARRSYPDLTVGIRELWEIVPHKGRTIEDDQAKAVQDFIGYRMTRFVRKSGHVSMNIVGDTQVVGDLESGVRQMFNRFVVFDADHDTVKNIFKWTSNNRHKSFRRRITSRIGEAGIVGKIEPARRKKGIEYISPVAYAPPSFHHLDRHTERTGWIVRTQHLEHEELRRPDWDTSIPDDLAIPPTREIDAVADEEDDRDPRAEARAAARTLYRQGLSYRAIRDEFEEEGHINPETGEPWGISTIGDMVDGIEKGSALEGGG
jgi:hypothetical protein